MKKTIRAERPIGVGISTCLLGQKVRFDGQHKHDRYITDILGDYFQFVPVCPEVEIGMGIPREAVNLRGAPDAPRMVGNKTGKDWTDKMNAYAEKRVRRRDLSNLSGYILKKDSPSCGMERVRVYGESGSPQRTGIGLYAGKLMEAHPLLPVEEEGRLHDAPIRENFIERVFAYFRLQKLFAGSFKPGAVVDFHTRNKYLILSHSPKHYTEMGRLVAGIKQYAADSFIEKYGALYMEAFKIRATVKKHVNVLQHIMGFLKRDLSAEDKRRVLEVLDDYHRELVPLIVPLTLIKHLVHIHKADYIIDQLYLNPHPKELMLRNHV